MSVLDSGGCVKGPPLLGRLDPRRDLRKQRKKHKARQRDVRERKVTDVGKAPPVERRAVAIGEPRFAVEPFAEGLAGARREEAHGGANADQNEQADGDG